MSVIGRKALLDVGCSREALPDVRDWSGGPHSCPGVDGRYSRMSESGREALLEDC